MRVIELRNYLIRDGMTDDFVRYFEEHFLFSQREAGMHVLGQFEVVGAPNRFVWIRGFKDMGARRQGLEGFYGGPVLASPPVRGQRHDPRLRRGAPAPATRGRLDPHRRPGPRGAGDEPPGAVPSRTGLVAVDFYRAEPGMLDRLVALFEHRVRPALLEQGHQVLGHFVADLTPNDYPRLPVIQDPTLLVVLSAYRDAEHWTATRAEPDGDPWRTVLEEDHAGAADRPRDHPMRLRPTARSSAFATGAREPR